MATVSELTSKNISSAQANVQTWGNVLYNVKVYGAKGDGVTDDTAAIQQALDAAEGGGTVLLSEGIYKITYSLLIGSNTTIRGLGRNSIIKAVFSNTICSLIVNKNMSTLGGYTAAENIELSNFAIQTNANGIGFSHAQNIRIFNIFSDDSTLTWHYIDLAGVKNATVKGCTFINDGTSGGDLVQIDAALVSSAVMYLNENGTSGGTLVDGTGSENIYIKENYLQFDSDVSGLIVLHRDPVENVYIENNILINGYAGVYLQGGINKNINVVRNKITNRDRSVVTYSAGAVYGINLNAGSVDNVIIKDNNLEHCGISANNVDNSLTIEGNIISTFYVSNAISGIGKMFINNNKINTHKIATGISTSIKSVFRIIGTPSAVNVKNNTFDNSLGDVAQTTLSFLATCDYVEIEGNTFDTIGAAYDGVNIRPVTPGCIEFITSIKNLKVKANKFYNSVGGVSFGASLTEANDILIDGNTFNVISHPFNFTASTDSDNIRIINNDIDTFFIGVLKNNNAKTKNFTNVEINNNTFKNAEAYCLFVEALNLSYAFNDNKIISGGFGGDGTASVIFVSLDATGTIKGRINNNRILTVNNKFYISATAANCNITAIQNDGDFTPYFGGMIDTIKQIVPFDLYTIPTQKIKGTMYFDTSTNVWKFWNGTAWTAM